MRVLEVGNMYPPHHEGGYELLWRSATDDLRARGHDVSVLTTVHRQPGVDACEEPGVERSLRWYWRDHNFVRPSWRERVEIERHNANAFDAAVGRARPEVVCWWAMGGMSLGLIERARRAGLPAVFVVIDNWPVYAPRADAWTGPLRRLGPLAAIVERATGLPSRVRLENAGPWLFASRSVRGHALDSGLRPAREEIVNPGIKPVAPVPPGTWGSRLLCFGRVDDRKGLDTAIDAISHLGSEASLRIVGDGEETVRRGLGERVREAGLQARVRIERGVAREDLAAIVGEADVVLFPVRWEEPWGLVPLEAMALGRPVVATGLGGSGEYLRDGENCLLVTPDAPTALAAAVRRLGADVELRNSIIQGGIETASRFPESAFHDRIEAALRRAVSITA